MTSTKTSVFKVTEFKSGSSNNSDSKGSKKSKMKKKRRNNQANSSTTNFVVAPRNSNEVIGNAKLEIQRSDEAHHKKEISNASNGQSVKPMQNVKRKHTKFDKKKSQEVANSSNDQPNKPLQNVKRNPKFDGKKSEEDSKSPNENSIKPKHNVKRKHNKFDKKKSNVFSKPHNEPLQNSKRKSNTFDQKKSEEVTNIGISKKRKLNNEDAPPVALTKNKGPPKLWGIPQTKTESPSELEILSLETVGGFDLNATVKDLSRVVSQGKDEKSDSEDSDTEVSAKRKKLTPAEKKAKALEEERKLKRKEKELLKAEENPESPDHFERLLVGNPNSSELWIKYMGYHAVNADIEKARAIARRAIKRIDPQLVTDKLNVWIALLNLEHTFSPPDVFKETFTEALKCNDDYSINNRVLSLYSESKKVTEVDQLTNVMTKKYKDKMDCWLRCQDALMTVGLPEKARSQLQKALLILPKKEHVTLISRFALLENKHGFAEQAQAVFENLLTSYPQRLDVLSVYVDMLVKSQSIDIARSVLERAANHSLPARKMKSIYVKWLNFEENHGTASDVAKVEMAAKKYVSGKLGSHREGMTNEKEEEMEIKKEEKEEVEEDYVENVKSEVVDFEDYSSDMSEE